VSLEKQAFGELTDLFGASAARRPLLGTGIFTEGVLMHMEQRMMILVARFAPVTATAVPWGKGNFGSSY